jgi:acyl-CoA synthetase (AMP-forming)/AMP-acid ligase II
MPPRLAAENLGEFWSLSCRWKGDEEFLVDDGMRLSGREALSLTSRLAAGLAHMGLRPGSRVALLSASSVRHAVAFFAAHQAGLITCALHALDSDERLAACLDWIEADALFVDRGNAPRVETILGAARRTVRTVSLDDGGATGSQGMIDELPRAAGTPPDSVRGGGDDCLILLSSGTTGEPKGVVHTHASVLATAAAGPIIYNCARPSESTIVVMAPSFAAWLYVVLPFVAIRGKIVFQERFAPDTFVDALARERVTMVPLVPTAWRLIMAASAADVALPDLRIAFYSGEPGSRSLVEALSERFGCEIRTAYLSSEGGCASACIAGSETLVAGAKPASTGRPVALADLRIADPDGGIEDATARDESGEILLSSASLAGRYWKAPDLTAQRFVGRWWRSGDLGMVDPDGDVFIQGRTDNVINTGGIKVHAEEVEAALMRHPAVAMAAVVGPPDPTWGQRIEAHVVLKQTVDEPEATLIRFCRDVAGLPGSKTPKAVLVHEKLPIGPTGKLFRRSLLAS